jgi:hypothetical protein
MKGRRGGEERGGWDSPCYNGVSKLGVGQWRDGLGLGRRSKARARARAGRDDSGVWHEDGRERDREIERVCVCEREETIVVAGWWGERGGW